MRSMALRRIADRSVKALSFAAAAAGIFILFWILWKVGGEGLGVLDKTFFTELPTPPGIGGGGMANAILGTLYITVTAAVIAVPLGMMAGVYIAEFGRGTRLGAATRFVANVLMGLPSIIVGVFVYTILVVPVGHFSGWAGSVALAIMMLPIVTRTTEEMLALVPHTLRESALALGAPRWRVTLQIVFRAARNGLVTGVLLAIARVSGEAAPLLFTALNSPYWVESLSEPTANLTVTIFNFAMSPYEDWQEAAWGASFLITAGVLCLSLLTRAALREKKG
jgi:phosphate transport system permease protein